MTDKYLVRHYEREIADIHKFYGEQISALIKQIECRDNELHDLTDEHYEWLGFAIKQGKVREAVEHFYREMPGRAKEVVKGYHDEDMDLSTIPCTGEDFRPRRKL